MRILYFGPAREITGLANEEIGFDHEISTGDLCAHLALLYPTLERLLATSRIAVEMEYVTDGTMIPSLAEVAIIPPVAGG